MCNNPALIYMRALLVGQLGGYNNYDECVHDCCCSECVNDLPLTTIMMNVSVISSAAISA